MRILALLLVHVLVLIHPVSFGQGSIPQSKKPASNGVDWLVETDGTSGKVEPIIGLDGTRFFPHEAEIVRKPIAKLLSAPAGLNEISGPPGSQAFGSAVAILPNGNIVVTDPLFDLPGPVVDVGAVYLFDGTTLEEISRLTGSSPGDQVGNRGIVSLSTGNFVISSPDWDGPGAANAGAVTFVNGDTGLSGPVSASNSLVGSSTFDQIGMLVPAFPDGDYLVTSSSWDAPGAVNAGALTFGNGQTGISGPVSALNSLVGSSANDSVGSTVFGFAEGNYLALSPTWDSGGIIDVGAVTFGNGETGVVGPVSQQNSLTGSSQSDRVGSGLLLLSNGNYVVFSRYWSNGPAARVGAITLGNGKTGTTGIVSTANSLVGSTALDEVGHRGVALPNGNFVVGSPRWNAPGAEDAGAVTFVNGEVGASGVVSAANSLVGSTAFDQFGSKQVIVLANGNYVISNDYSALGEIFEVGSVTLGSGTSGISGVVSSANSLVGSNFSDQVGTNVFPLTNGNYVVTSPGWRFDGNARAGAATFANGKTGITGPVSPSNSLIGTVANDRVGSGVVALSNGNYVVRSVFWSSSGVGEVGAVTFANGQTGITGTISPQNSLVGSSPGDRVGTAAHALPNGNYLVSSPLWDSGSLANVGAVTFANGTTGISGAVTSVNSLVGSSAEDRVGTTTLVLSNGDYVVASPMWDHNGIANVGAVTFANEVKGVVGTVSPENSLVGTSADDQIGSQVLPKANGDVIVRSEFWDAPGFPNAGAVTLCTRDFPCLGSVSSANSVLGRATNDVGGLDYDETNQRLVVGLKVSNVVVVFSPEAGTTSPIFDFDGDGKTDISVFRPVGGSGSEWWYLRSSDGGNRAFAFGEATDTVVPADFTGDGKTDLAFWRPASGEWFVLRSDDSTFFAFPFGAAGDVPSPADFDGDGKSDATVYRPSTNTWFTLRSSDGQVAATPFGTAGDKPVPADYDGDGKADVAIFRPTGGSGGGEWWYLRSSDGANRAFAFGTSTTVPGDYTGDGKADLAYFRPSTGEWYVLRSEDSSFYAFPWGANGDLPAPGDYDGDGKIDAAVFRPSNSNWFALRSTAGPLILQFGTTGDRPLPNAYVR